MDYSEDGPLVCERECLDYPVAVLMAVAGRGDIKVMHVMAETTM